MGYTLVLILGAVAVVALVVAMMSARRRPAGRTGAGDDVTPKNPSAESPTPDASSTTGSRVTNEAQRHTPPA